MKMNRNEMEALYAFGCPNLKATVERLRIRSIPDCLIYSPWNFRSRQHLKLYKLLLNPQSIA